MQYNYYRLYLSVIGAGGEDGAKLWMGPVHLPRRTFVAVERKEPIKSEKSERSKDSDRKTREENVKT